jgi:hypothetical protein
MHKKLLFSFMEGYVERNVTNSGYAGRTPVSLVANITEIERDNITRSNYYFLLSMFHIFARKCTLG